VVVGTMLAPLCPAHALRVALSEAKPQQLLRWWLRLLLRRQRWWGGGGGGGLPARKAQSPAGACAAASPPPSEACLSLHTRSAAHTRWPESPPGPLPPPASPQIAAVPSLQAHRQAGRQGTAACRAGKPMSRWGGVALPEHVAGQPPTVARPQPASRKIPPPPPARWWRPRHQMRARYTGSAGGTPLAFISGSTASASYQRPAV
jgi:hypothetical protein